MTKRRRSFFGRFARVGFVACGALTSVGCSAQLEAPAPAFQTGQINSAPPATSRSSTAELDRALLSEKERQLDCRRITGRMQVRILQIRDRLEPTGNSFTGIIKTAIAASYDAMSVNATETGDYSLQARTTRDVAVLQAYNRLLAEKGCATFDLEAELQPRPISHTPAPVVRK